MIDQVNTRVLTCLIGCAWACSGWTGGGGGRWTAAAGGGGGTAGAAASASALDVCLVGTCVTLRHRAGC